MSRKFNLFNVILYVALNLDTRLVSADATSSICKGGVSFKKTLSDKLIELPVGKTTISLTCAALDSAIPFVVPNASSEDCLLIQSLGSLCGCPVEADACKLCTDGTAILSPNNTLPFLEEQFGFIPTCELLEAYLLSQNTTNNTLCSVSQGLLAEYCGCNGAKISKGCSFCPDGQLVPSPEKELNISGLPFKTCGQLESALSLVVEDGQETCTTFQKLSSYCGCGVAENACEMCPHGNIAYPDKPLSSVVGNTGIDSFEPTCKIFEALTRSTLTGSKECFLAHLMGGYCGCPPVDNFCTLCRGGKIPEEAHSIVLDPEFMKKVVGLDAATSFTCSDAESFLSQIDKNDGTLCYTSQYRGDLCGCYGGGFGYFGTEEHPERRPAFPWLMRVSALLSMISVLLISLDVLRDKKKIQNVYCRLMLGMSIFDFFSGFAWLANSAAIPYDIAEPIYGASGNEATCKAQCFFFQLSLGSILYNVSLSTYYYMVIVMSKREQWLKKQQLWLHGMPILTCLVLSFASIPFASNDYYGCHVPISPKEWDWASYGLYVLPVGFVLFYCTSLISYICWSVKRQNSAANKWSFPIRAENTSGNASSISSDRKKEKKKKGSAFNKLQSQVMWQSVFYLGAFWCTWPLFVWAYVALDTITGLPQPWEYIYYVVSFTFAPLQGFLNGLIYFRSKISRMLCNQKVKPTREEVPTSHTWFTSFIGFPSFLSKSKLSSWIMPRHGVNNAMEERIHTSIIPSEHDIICESTLKNESSIKCNDSAGHQAVEDVDSLMKVTSSFSTKNLNMDEEIRPSFRLSRQSGISKSQTRKFVEVNDTDPSILLAAMTPMDESENDTSERRPSMPCIEETKEPFS
jgi:hypothetical protein